MANLMNVACIILNYNDYLTTEQLIKHIHEFDSLDNIVIVDNCSSNDSYNKLLKYRSNKIRVIKTDKNKGYGAGNNYGVMYCKEVLNSDYVVIANPDVIFDEEFVVECIEVLKKESDVAIVTGLMLDGHSMEVQKNAWYIPTAIEEVIDSSSILKRIVSFLNRDKKHELYDLENKYFEAVAGSLFAMDVNKFIEIGMFDEDIFLYCEENILAIKMKEAGYRAARLNNIKYKHFHSTSISKEYKKMYYRKKILIDSKKIVISKYYPISKFKKKFLFFMLDLFMIEAAIIEFFKIIARIK